MSTSLSPKMQSLLACVAIAFTALMGLNWISDLPMLGFDAYPLIASSGVESLGDFGRLFTKELMDGRYPDGHFHRPLVQLSFALDRALHGMQPKGYHWTNLITCALSGVLIFALARRIGGLGIGFACLAGLLFVGHPLQAEVLPFPARRADNMALALILLVLFLQAGPREPLKWKRVLAIGALSWCALAAKETGAVVALLAPLLVFTEATGTVKARIISSAKKAWPAALGIALGIGARQLVLGGLAGHEDSNLMGGLSLPAFDYLWRVLYSQPWLGWDERLGSWLLWGLFALLIASAWKQRSSATVFLVLWLTLLLLVSGLAGRVHEWYALLFVPATVILLASGLEWSWSQLKSPDRRLLAHGLLYLSGATVSLSILFSGPLIQQYGNLIDGGRMLNQNLIQVNRLLDQAQPGFTSRLNPWVPILPPHSDGSENRGVALAAAYSLQAFVDLRRPDLRSWVRPLELAANAPSKDVWVLELVQQPLPSWIRQH